MSYIKPYTSKVFIVDEAFMGDLKQRSQTEYALFADPGIDSEILRLPLAGEAIESVIRVIDPSAIHAGNIVVKPSYSDEFVPIGQVSEDVVLRKYGLFVQLCVLLGAKKVAVASVEGVKLESTNDRKAGLAFSGGGFGVEHEASGHMDQSSLSKTFQESIMRLNTEADGGEPDLKAAEALMSRYGLHKDTLFNGLLTMRQTCSNKLRRHELTLDSARDMNRIFDRSMGVKLEVMSKLYKGKAEFEYTRKSIEEGKHATQLSVTVEF